MLAGCYTARERIEAVPSDYRQRHPITLQEGNRTVFATAGFTQATLWVLESNARARQFYAKGGWVEDGAVTQDDSHGFPISEVRYRRQLP